MFLSLLQGWQGATELCRERSIFRKKKKWRVRIPMDPGSGAVMPCFSLLLWDIVLRRRPPQKGLLLFVVSIVCPEVFRVKFFCPHSHLTNPAYGGFLCRVSLSESFPILVASPRNPFPVTSTRAFRNSLSWCQSVVGCSDCILLFCFCYFCFVSILFYFEFCFVCFFLLALFFLFCFVFV